MSTRKQKDIKFLGMRIPTALWMRIRRAVAALGTTTKAFCIEAIERHLDRVERKQDGVEINGKTVREVHRKSSQGEV